MWFFKFFLGKNIEVVINSNIVVILLWDLLSYDELLVDIYEKVMRKFEGVILKKYGNFDVIESELFKLKLEMNKMLVDF